MFGFRNAEATEIIYALASERRLQRKMRQVLSISVLNEADKNLTFVL